nr:NDRG, alpha/beta hydrolase fold protein [Tanacetum cinerariifolium]
MCVLLQELQKSTGVATGSLHNAMPKFLGSLGIEFGFRQADSVHVIVPKEFERGMNGPKQQLLSTFVTVTNLKLSKLPDITDGLKRLQCRTLIFVGDNFPFRSKSLHMTSKLDRRFSALIEMLSYLMPSILVL